MADSPRSTPYDLSSSDPLLEHVGALYALAQAATDSPAEAARLVEATYGRAAAADGRPEGSGRLWLFRLLADLRREGHPPAATPGEGDGDRSEPLGAARGYRRQAAERALERALPAAFAALPETGRLLLLLCTVENLSCADAGTVLGLSSDAACTRLEDAFLRLRTRLYESATPAERRLFDDALSDAALRSALQRLATDAFATPPSALRPVAEASLRRRAHRSAQPRSEASADQAVRPENMQPEELQAVQRGTPQRSAHQRARRRGASSGTNQRLRRALIALLLIGLAGLAGYGATAYFEAPSSSQSAAADLIALSARRAGDVQEITQTNDPAEAERFVREQTGQRVSAPSVAGAALSGVGIVEVAPEVRVPVFIYVDEDGGQEGGGQDIALYAYTYALLDRYEGRVQLDRALLQQIAEDDVVETRRTEAGSVLVWRSRDDIFVAVSPGGDAEALRGRITS